MPTRLSFTVRNNPNVECVALSHHPVRRDGTLETLPTRSYEIAPGVEHPTFISPLYGIALLRLDREPVSIELTHCDPEVPRRLEITLLRELPGEPPVEVGRFELRPGYCTDVHLIDAERALIRELPNGYNGGGKAGEP